MKIFTPLTVILLLVLVFFAGWYAHPHHSQKVIWTYTDKYLPVNTDNVTWYYCRHNPPAGSRVWTTELSSCDTDHLCDCKYINPNEH